VSAGDGSAPGWPDYGEFDISEVNGIRPDLTFGTFHFACAGRESCNTSSGNVYNLATHDSYTGTSNWGPLLTPSNFGSTDGQTETRFVRYGFLWEANRITWYADGQPIRFFDGTHIVRIKPDGSHEIEKTLGVDLYPSNAPTYSFATVFGYEHSIDLNLAF